MATLIQGEMYVNIPIPWSIWVVLVVFLSNERLQLMGKAWWFRLVVWDP